MTSEPGHEGEACDSLSGLPKHDAKHWGAPYSNHQPPQKLVRLVDVVHMICAQTGIESVRYCAGQLLEALESITLPLLFRLHPGPLAVPFADDHVWRRRYPSGAETVAKSNNDNNSSIVRVMGPVLEAGEAEARGLNQDPNIFGYDVSDAEICLWPELPELRGPAGALALMQQQWGQQALTFDDLDIGPLAAVAILEPDAVPLFGKKPADRVARPSSSIHSSSGKAAPDLWPHQDSATWSGEQLNAMFKMRHLDQMTDRAIATRVKCERSRVGQLIGSKNQWKDKDGFKGKPWQPSAQLLAECGLKPLQALQSVARVLA